jgi:hypothetical protein
MASDRTRAVIGYRLLVIRSEPKRVSGRAGLKWLPQLRVGFVQPTNSLFIEVAGFTKTI